ncbi:unnamed protein product [Rhizophagus irregularis]|nr:unnamed protein product [Rhizophagus irregularis]
MWEFTSGVPPFDDRSHDIQLSLSICRGERPEITENTPQCYVDLMKKCWDENPLKRPSSKEILNIIGEWIFPSYSGKIENINEELKCNIMEFINAPIENNNLAIESHHLATESLRLATESHPQACYTSRLLDFTSKKLNDTLESEELNNCLIQD